MKFSVSDVRLGLKCPRMFYLCKKEGCRSYPYTGEFVGSLVHDTLKDFMRIISDKKRFPVHFKVDDKFSKEHISKRVEQLLYEVYLALIERRTKLRKYLQIKKAWDLLSSSRNKISNLLLKALARYSPEEIPSKLILGVEKKFSFDIAVGEDEFTITGRIDLILKDPESEQILVWDYKTGTPESIDLDSVQLALYSMGLEQEFGDNIKASIIYMMEDGIRESSIPNYNELRPLLYELLTKMKKWLKDKPKKRTVTDVQCQICHLKKICFEFFDGIIPPDDVTEIIRGKLGGTKTTTKTVTNKGKKELILGNIKNSTEIINVNPNDFTRHIGVIGASGSGKTVLSKVIIEEMMKQNLPVLAIDPQGDIASLICAKSVEGKEIVNQMKYLIFTPGSNKAENLTLDPFALKPLKENIESADYNEYERSVLDDISMTLLNLLNLDPTKKTTEKAFLEAVIKDSWQNDESLSFKSLAEYMLSVEEIAPVHGGSKIPVDQLIKKSQREKLARELMALAVGTDGAFFRGGKRMNLQELDGDKYNLYVVHLGSVGTDVKKRQMVLSWIIRSIYDWMLRNPPPDQSLRLLFYIDEVADFLPPHPRYPPSKKMLMLLLRQARKYGVGVMLATQSPGDIDYKAFDNTSTLFLGKIQTKQSITKILDMIEAKLKKAKMTTSLVASNLMSAKVGEFLLVPLKDIPQIFQSRMVYTEHITIAFDDLPDYLK